MTPGARGFTLLEVLVALAIIAIGLSATLRYAQAGVDTADALERRAEAHWVAGTAAAEARLDPPPAASVRNGVERMGHRDYRWEMRAGGADAGGALAIAIDVADAARPAQVLAHLDVLAVTKP
ncbi:MAG: type II secretion system minor pseudopilin GspI [Gammaproteobacteria bacterium]